uniref:Major sperm protein n=1 Tax=Setaria digitata TaxID=48799 RepID=A0A915PYU7_9BILA
MYKREMQQCEDVILKHFLWWLSVVPAVASGSAGMEAHDIRCAGRSHPDSSLFKKNRNHLTWFEQHAKERVIRSQSGCGHLSGDNTSGIVGDREVMLDTFKTIPKESYTATGLSITRLSLTTARSLPTRIRKNEDGKTEIANRNRTLTTAVGKTSGSGRCDVVVRGLWKLLDRLLADYKGNSSGAVEGLVSFPESQVTIRSGHTGPVILAFTNNYKKSVIWALKTNAIRRLAAFPTAGIIPPSETVQIKVDLVEKIPEKNLKDRLSLEYFVTDRKVVNDSIYYSFFRHSGSTRMKKNLEIVYV